MHIIYIYAYSYICIHTSTVEPAKSETHFASYFSINIFSKKIWDQFWRQLGASCVLGRFAKRSEESNMENCFYKELVISQPEQNIRAWGKKIIKLVEVHAEVRLGMNLFLFCLPLAVPSTFRPKRPPELGQRSGFKDVWAAFLQMLTLAARSWSLMR